MLFPAFLQVSFRVRPTGNATSAHHILATAGGISSLMTMMNRERFNSVLAALSLSPSSRTFAGGVSAPEPAILRLHANGWAPNNDRLPVLLYRSVLDLKGGDPAGMTEARFEKNGWPAQWRDGIYDFHHYHSTAHEVLGVVNGQARVLLGGEAGTLVQLNAGDAVVLPVGSVHCCLSSSKGFLVVGGYPAGQNWDVRRKAPTAASKQRMESLSVPACDPLTGKSGALRRLWIARKTA